MTETVINETSPFTVDLCFVFETMAFMTGKVINCTSQFRFDHLFVCNCTTFMTATVINDTSPFRVDLIKNNNNLCICNGPRNKGPTAMWNCMAWPVGFFLGVSVAVNFFAGGKCLVAVV